MAEYKHIILKKEEYDRLVALAKRKGFSHLAQYVYSMLDEEVKKTGLTREQLLALIEKSKYGEEYKDYW